MLGNTNVFLDTRDAINPLEPSNATFLLDFALADFHKTELSVENVMFANTVTPVNSLNSLVVIEENNGAETFSFNLDHESYTGTRLASELQSILNTLSVEGITYTCSYNENTKKLSVTADSLNFRFGAGTTAQQVLGLSETQVEGEYLSSQNSAVPVRLDGVEYVDLISNLSVRNVSSNQKTNILARIPLTVGFGEVEYYQNTNGATTTIFSRDIDNLELRLVGANGGIFPLPEGSHVVYNLRFTFS